MTVCYQTVTEDLKISYMHMILVPQYRQWADCGGLQVRIHFGRIGIGAVALTTISIMAANVQAARAETNDLGTVEITSNKETKVDKTTAIGSKADPGSAPALAPSQGNLLASEPGSVVSDKVIKDVIAPSGNYLNVVQYTPGAYSTTPNGSGDSKGGWRGFADGQYNVTFDGIPFGDANDPSHHTGAYFPAPFIGSIMVDRGPGKADQVGYAPFGGTLSMFSPEVKDTLSGTISQSVGNYNTFNTFATINSGILNPSGTKFTVSYSHQNTDGTLAYGRDNATFGSLKLVQPLNDFTMTAYSTYGQQYYNQVGNITAAQLAAFGKNFGSLSGDSRLGNFYGYNNSLKQTDLEYIDLKGSEFGWDLENKVYTYAYNYPMLQNNGNDLTCIGFPCAGNKQFTVGGVKVPAATDITGYIKVNNYRGYGDIATASREISAGMLSGVFKTGIWFEQVDNHREQQYNDYTTGRTYSSLGVPLASAYKLKLDSHITNFQPFVQYEWKPTAQLSITPGVKFESFERRHVADVNQTTLLPANIDKTYTGLMPFLDVRYRVTPEVTVYGQASQGFLAPPVAAYYVTNFAANSVQPQRSDNYQTGVIFKNNTFTVDADIYWINASHYSFSYTDPATMLTSYRDGGSATFKGIEAEGTYTIVKNLALYAAGSVSSAKYATGLAINNAPNYTATLGTIYDDGTYFGSVMNKFVGDQYGAAGQTLVGGVTSQLNKVAAYNSTDIVAGYRTDAVKTFSAFKTLELKAGVNNLFNNRSTIDIGGTPNSLTNNSNLTYAFQPSRTWYVQLKADF